jgi:hypothetical protein
VAIVTTTRHTSTLRLKTRRPVISKPIRVELTIANESSEPLTIVDPEVGLPPPDLHWTASDEAYRIGILMSFGLMQITLKDADGKLADSKGLTPWVTPLLGKRVLETHASLTLEFDLNELFVIDSPGNYLACARYGDEDAFGIAELHLEILSTQGDVPHE